MQSGLQSQEELQANVLFTPIMEALGPSGLLTVIHLCPDSRLSCYSPNFNFNVKSIIIIIIIILFSLSDRVNIIKSINKIEHVVFVDPSGYIIRLDKCLCLIICDTRPNVTVSSSHRLGPFSL